MSNVAIIGHSHGGGATRDLAERLERNKRAIDTNRTKLNDITKPFNLVLTVYLDAVHNGMNGAERRLPPGTEYHLNLYQPGWDWSGVVLRISGNTTTEEIPAGFTSLEQIDVVNDWGLSADHYTIDDQPRVKRKLSDMLELKVSR